MSNRWEGSKYRATMDLTVVEICKLIRKDIQEGEKSGRLPRGIKCGVRKSAGRGLDITVKALPADFQLYTYAVFKHTAPVYHMHTEAHKALLKELGAIGEAYNWNGNDSMTDLFGQDRYVLSVRIADEVEDAEKALLSGIPACHECGGWSSCEWTCPVYGKKGQRPGISEYLHAQNKERDSWQSREQTGWQGPAAGSVPVEPSSEEAAEAARVEQQSDALESEEVQEVRDLVRNSHLGSYEERRVLEAESPRLEALQVLERYWTRKEGPFSDNHHANAYRMRREALVAGIELSHVEALTLAIRASRSPLKEVRYQAAAGRVEDVVLERVLNHPQPEAAAELVLDSVRKLADSPQVPLTTLAAEMDRLRAAVAQEILPPRVNARPVKPTGPAPRTPTGREWLEALEEVRDLRILYSRGWVGRDVLEAVLAAGAPRLEALRELKAAAERMYGTEDTLPAAYQRQLDALAAGTELSHDEAATAETEARRQQRMEAIRARMRVVNGGRLEAA